MSSRSLAGLCGTGAPHYPQPLLQQRRSTGSCPAFPPGKLFPHCVSKAGRVTLGLSSIPVGRSGSRPGWCGEQWEEEQC